MASSWVISRGWPIAIDEAKAAFPAAWAGGTRLCDNSILMAKERQGQTRTLGTPIKRLHLISHPPEDEHRFAGEFWVLARPGAAETNQNLCMALLESARAYWLTVVRAQP